MKFLIGADPEFFIKKKYGGYTSAVGLIGGSKWEPKKIDEDGHAILEDNVAVEFNIKPASSFDEFRSSIHKVLDHIRGILPGYEFSKESAVSFPQEELMTPEAQMFGCEPVFDAWRECVNISPYHRQQCFFGYNFSLSYYTKNRINFACYDRLSNCSESVSHLEPPIRPTAEV